MERAVRKIREAISPRLATSSFLITGTSPTHPEDAEAAASLDWPRVNGRQSDPQHGAGVTRVDDAVVVQAGADEEGVRLALDLRLDLLPPLLVGLGVVVTPGGLRRGPADDRQHAGELLRAHDGQLGVGPGEHQPRVVGAAGHAVVARAERRRHVKGDVGDGRVGDRVDHLGAVLDDPALLVPGAHHVAGGVLQEDQRRVRLVGEQDELARLLGLLAEQDAALVSQDADRVAVDR